MFKIKGEFGRGKDCVEGRKEKERWW